MQAAVVNEFGQAPKYQSFNEPTPEEGEAIIRVRAAGLRPVVKALASGTHYASGGGGALRSRRGRCGGTARWRESLFHVRAQTLEFDVRAHSSSAL